MPAARMLRVAHADDAPRRPPRRGGRCAAVRGLPDGRVGACAWIPAGRGRGRTGSAIS